jgi:pimeloyl-ACP methyl ester carboxylesterase
MTTPHRVVEHRIIAADGRTLALTDRGPADGPVVVLLHSAPGSRHLDPDPAATAATGVRLLTMDRPGYGDSTALPEDMVPTLAALADDVAHALRELGVPEAGIAGWSAGGRVALGVAARHPDLVRAIALIGTPAPDDDVPWIPAEYREALQAMRAAPATAYPAMTAAFGGAPVPPDPLLMIMGGDADGSVLADDAAADRLREMLAAAHAQGPAGTAADVVAANVPPPGYDDASVGAPVALFYADGDEVVSPAHGDWWAGRLASTTRHPVSGVGHLLVVPAWPDVLTTLMPSTVTSAVIS